MSQRTLETYEGETGTAELILVDTAGQGVNRFRYYWQRTFFDNPARPLVEVNKNNPTEQRIFILESIGFPEEQIPQNIVDIAQNPPPEFPVEWILTEQKTFKQWAMQADATHTGAIQTLNRMGSSWATYDNGNTLVTRLEIDDTSNLNPITGVGSLFQAYNITSYESMNLAVQNGYKMNFSLYVRKTTHPDFNDERILEEGMIEFDLIGYGLFNEIGYGEKDQLFLNPINFFQEQGLVYGNYPTTDAFLIKYNTPTGIQNYTFDDWVEFEESKGNQSFVTLPEDNFRDFTPTFRRGEIAYYLTLNSVETRMRVTPNNGWISNDGNWQWVNGEWVYIGPLVSTVVEINEETGEEEEVIEIVESEPVIEENTDTEVDRVDTEEDSVEDDSSYLNTEIIEEDEEITTNQGNQNVNESGGTNKGDGDMEIDDANENDNDTDDDFIEPPIIDPPIIDPEPIPKKERDWGKIFMGIAVIGGIGFLVYLLLSRTKKTDSVQVSKKSSPKMTDSVQVDSTNSNPVAQNPSVETNVEVNLDG